MLNDLNYILILISFIPLIYLFFAPPSNEDAEFVRLSTIFMLFFYVIPMLLCSFNGELSYASELYYIDPYLLLNSIISFYFFLFGFSVIGQGIVTKYFRFNYDRHSSMTNRPLRISTGAGIILICLTAIILIVYKLATPDVNTLYEVRTGAQQFSHFKLLFLGVTQSVLMSILFLLIGARWRFAALILLAILLLFRFDAASGRTSLLVMIALAGILVLSIRVRTATILGSILAVVGLPIILIGKTVIYYLSVERRLPNIEILSGAFRDVLERYLQNFSHPFISMHEVFALLKITGFRFFYDIPQGFLFYLRAAGIDMGSSLTYFNTQNLLGAHESIVPTGYLAFGFVQAGFLGVVVMGTLYRLSYLVLINTKLFRIAKSDALVFYLSFLAANTFYTGEVRTLVITFFLPVIVMNYTAAVVAYFVVNRKTYDHGSHFDHRVLRPISPQLQRKIARRDTQSSTRGARSRSQLSGK